MLWGLFFKFLMGIFNFLGIFNLGLFCHIHNNPEMKKEKKRLVEIKQVAVYKSLQVASDRLPPQIT